MEAIICHLVSRFEKNSPAAQEGLDFKDANIDPVSIHVATCSGPSRSTRRCSASLCSARITKCSSRNHGGPAGVVDHFAIGVLRFDRDSAARYLTQRGANPLQGDEAGLHIKDPDGINVQISRKA